MDKDTRPLAVPLPQKPRFNPCFNGFMDKDSDITVVPLLKDQFQPLF